MDLRRRVMPMIRLDECTRFRECHRLKSQAHFECLSNRAMISAADFGSGPIGSLAGPAGDQIQGSESRGRFTHPARTCR